MDGSEDYDLPSERQDRWIRKYHDSAEQPDLASMPIKPNTFFNPRFDQWYSVVSK